MPYLVVENGSRRGFKVEIPPNGKVVLGRDGRADIEVSDHLCSRTHFEVETKEDGFTLRDLGSSNGTYVNDERLTEDASLRHGDCIQAGETQLTFLVDTGQGARGLVGKTVGGYRILERIGRGGMGTVYRANQTSLNRTVALKILSPKIAEDPAFVSKFHKEAQAAGRLNHTNIVQVYDVGSEGGLHFYSMEYIENGSVQDLATREGKVSPELAIAIVIDAAKGLEYAEKKALVHRDIKPDNLMVNAEGVVKIADLGLARDAAKTARETGEHAGEHHENDDGIFGTPHFIAPEQAQGKAVDTRSDIYSLGASFYRLVTGETPFQGSSVREIIRKQIDEEPTPVREKNREVPGSISQVIEKMMRKNPDKRPATATALLEELERINAQMEGRSRRGGVLVAGGIAIVAVAIAAFSFFGNQDPQPEKPEDPGKSAKPAPGPAVDVNKLFLEAIPTIQDWRLDNARLASTKRTEEALVPLVTRLEEFVAKYRPTSAWKKELVATSQDDLDRLRDEVAGLREARLALEEAARQKAAAAQKKIAELTVSIDAAIGAEDWGVATSTLLAGVRAEQLRGFAQHHETLRDRLLKITTTAQDKTRADRDAARQLLASQQFDQAKTLLQARLQNIRLDIDPDPRLDPIRELIEHVEADLAAVTTARQAKITADQTNDHKAGFAARQAAFRLLRKSYDPDQAKALLAGVSADLRTETWKSLIAEDIALVEALDRLRDGFIARIAAEPINKDRIQLLSSTGTRDIPWTLVKVDATSFDAKLGRNTRKFEFKSFTPGDLNRRLFSLRPAPAGTAELDEAILLLLTGDAIGALRRIAAATGTTPAIAARIHREAAALDTAAAIRQLEKTAEGNAMDYLRLLPLLDRFIKECRDTIAFVLNSDGTTSIF